MDSGGDVMPEVRVDIEVWCDSCGEGLCSESRGGQGSIHVNACEKCMDTAVEEAVDEAQSAGYAEGTEAGKREGYSNGFAAGYNKARSELECG